MTMFSRHSVDRPHDVEFEVRLPSSGRHAGRGRHAVVTMVDVERAASRSMFNSSAGQATTERFDPPSPLHQYSAGPRRPAATDLSVSTGVDRTNYRVDDYYVIPVNLTSAGRDTSPMLSATNVSVRKEATETEPIAVTRQSNYNRLNSPLTGEFSFTLERASM